MPDEFDEIYGHPELLPNELKGLREIRCDQCGHEMQILEQYENASVNCARCGQAITLHGVGLEIPEDVIDLKDGLPTSSRISNFHKRKTDGHFWRKRMFGF